MIPPEVRSLREGERFYFEKEGLLGLIYAGEVEVYASTSDGHERLFLLSCSKGAYFFGLQDEFKKVELYLFAKTEVTLHLYGADSLPELLTSGVEQLRHGMRTWFKALLDLQWLYFFAVREDEFVGQWELDDFLKEDNGRELWQTFQEHQKVLALLLFGQFHSLQKYFTNRLEQRRAKKEKLLRASLSTLTGEENFELLVESTKVKANDNIVYIVRRAAKFFQMDAAGIELPGEVQKQLYGQALLKRLVFKGGMQLRRVELKGDWYLKDGGVFFAWRKGEPVVLLPEKPGRYRLYQEKFPQGEEVTGDLAETLACEAYVCYAGFPKRSLKVRDLLSFMYHQCWKIDWQHILAASFIAGLIPVFTPIVTKTIFGDIIPLGDRQGLATITQVMMVAGFTSAAVSLVRSVAVLRVNSHVDLAAEAALWSHLLSLPAAFFKKYQTGELVNRMSGIETIRALFTSEFVSSIFNVLFSFWSVVLMCYYSLRLTLVALVVWVIYALITGFIYRRVYRYQKNLVLAANKTSAQVLQIFNGLAKFRCQGAEEQAFYLWARCFGEQWKWNLKLRWLNNYSSVINAVQPLLLAFAIYYMTIYNLEGKMNTGYLTSISYAEFLGFQAAFSSFNTALIAMIPLAVKIFSIHPQVENLRPILEAEPESADDKIEAGTLTGEIEIRNLSFAYNSGGPEVIKNINLRIKSGEAVAVVGRSGCGKSTLIRLLLGFEKPKRGAIYYDNQDLKELSLASVRSQMGVVLQDGQLMPGDILTNIVGTTTLTDKEAWAAVENVSLTDDIKAMPMQLYTAVSEGSGNISGGQRQRILIARSIVNNPRILLLDEATSSLDNTTQAVVARSLDNLHCTRIIVAHRLSTIRNVHRILVMDAGQIVEEGNYQELMDRGGLFAKLALRQLV